MEKKQPVILTKVLNSWPALNLWNDLAYLKSKAVGRLVPVETVAKEDASISFLSKTWSHEVMPLNDYIDQYFAQDDGNGKDTPHGYLAQHPLLDQIPSLRDDIRIPPFCYKPLISAWFGPTGTVSPLHNDPYQNVLAQIVGRKYLRIYDACHTDHLYPHISHLGHNSSIDLENPNHKKYPLFSQTPSWQTILQPGDLLYIPRHAWHYVRSLETSFSASFWFGAKMELVKDSDGIYKGKYVCKDE
ncbi:Clavaminate synthase-like protein [Globomyces pollinis-pini]|nr:Clavaminate synthase-like protein [Globomyces pollinis-pini]